MQIRHATHIIALTNVLTQNTPGSRILQFAIFTKTFQSETESIRPKQIGKSIQIANGNARLLRSRLHLVQHNAVLAEFSVTLLCAIEIQ